MYSRLFYLYLKEEKGFDISLKQNEKKETIRVGWLCWGLTSQSTIFQSCRDGAIASWVINQYFRGVKCLAQGHNTAAVGLEPRTSRSGVRHSTTEPLRSPETIRDQIRPLPRKIKSVHIFFLWAIVIFWSIRNTLFRVKHTISTFVFMQDSFD